MSQAMKRPEVLWKLRIVADNIYRLLNIDVLLAIASREYKRGFGFLDALQQILCLKVKRNLCIVAAFGIFYVYELSLKIHIFPLQPKNLAPSHPGEKGQLQHFPCLGMGVFLDGL